MSASGGTPRVVLIAGKLTAFDDPSWQRLRREIYRVNVRCPIPMLTPRGEPAARAQVFVRRQVGRIPVQLTAVADAFEQTPRPASSSGHAEEAIRRARDVRVEDDDATGDVSRDPTLELEADARTRTGDPHYE